MATHRRQLGPHPHPGAPTQHEAINAYTLAVREYAAAANGNYWAASDVLGILLDPIGLPRATQAGYREQH